jgi:TM2 domain-containing membrane protein YozV
MTEQKSFGTALLLWLLFGSLGAHRVYCKEKVSVLLWYWLAFTCTLSIIFWIDLFLLKGWCRHGRPANTVIHNHYH